MKNIYKSIFLFTMAIAIAGFYTSCSKDNEDGVPRISYVRVTNPLASDSLLAGASQGSLLAIIGENLQNASQIWFNDQKASLTSTYITSTSILVSIPTQVPSVVNNILKIIFSDGDSLKYDFIVEIHEPAITSMDCEYVLEGKVATIHGDYFYKPLMVTFSGGATGSLVSIGDQLIQVTVPAGVQPGQITVTTNFGATKSDFWFRDNRNILIDSDPFRGWWDTTFVVTNPGPDDPPAISGNFIHVKKFIGAWNYTQVAGGDAASMAPLSANIPDEAILKPALYNLKFEVNTKKPFNGSMVKLCIGAVDGDHGDYLWKPPYDTQGEWKTVVIPYEEVTASYTNLTLHPTNGYFTRFIIQGPGDLDCDMSFDNFRVVPKK